MELCGQAHQLYMYVYVPVKGYSEVKTECANTSDQPR